MDSPIVVSTGHVDAPGIAADLAILNEAAADVGLDVDLRQLATEGTRDQELVWHLRRQLPDNSGFIVQSGSPRKLSYSSGVIDRLAY